MLVFIQPTTVDNEPKNGENDDRPLQMLAFFQPTTVDKEPEKKPFR